MISGGTLELTAEMDAICGPVFSQCFQPTPGRRPTFENVHGYLQTILNTLSSSGLCQPLTVRLQVASGQSENPYAVLRQLATSDAPEQTASTPQQPPQPTEVLQQRGRWTETTVV